MLSPVSNPPRSLLASLALRAPTPITWPANLKSHGWNLITIDIQWYEPLAHTTEYRRGAIFETDVNGRLLPAPNRFPMTAESHPFKPIADYLHAKGLKFGLHLMRGILRQAVDRDSRIGSLTEMPGFSP